MPEAEAHFRATAPRYMRKLMDDFGLSELDAAAVFGNAGHESLGFTKLQEIKPTVAGSRGGYGWFQWTGPRRRDFEAYCERNNLKPSDNDANYAFLFVELKGPEKRALGKLKSADTLNEKVVAFEEAFERSGVKAFAKRQRWAAIALDAFKAAGLAGKLKPETITVTTPAGPPTITVPDPPPNLNRLLIVLGSIIAAIVAAAANFFQQGF
jgi:hypothetical protein